MGTKLEDIKSMNIFEKMSAISMEIGAIEKTLEVDGKRPYKAIFEGDVIDAVKPVEAKYRVYSYPFSRKKETRNLEREYMYEGQVRKSTSIVHHIETIYRFVNMDKPEEYIDVTSFGDGIDTGDKAPGKGMTYSDKYALIKAYKLSSGQEADPDSVPSPDPVSGEYIRSVVNPMQVTISTENSNSQTEQKPLKRQEKEIKETRNEPSAQTLQQQAPMPEAILERKEEVRSEARPKPTLQRKNTREEKHFPIPTTLEEAMAMPVEIGQDAGKNLTFGLLYNAKPNLVRWYAEEADLAKYPEVKAAAKLIYEANKQRP